MKQFFALITLLLVLANGMAGQTQKTLIKTMAIAPTTTSLQFNLPAAVEVQEWDEPTLRLVTTIDANVEANVLKALTTAGRYSYTTDNQLTTGVAVITMPKKNIEVMIGGQPLEDRLHIVIYVPRGTLYEVINQQVAGAVQ